MRRTIMKSIILLSLFVGLILSCFTTNTYATIVYDNTTNIGTAFYPSLYAGETGMGIEMGDEITLAGTERIVTELQVRIFSNYTLDTPDTVDIVVHFYRNDGPDGA